MSDDLFEQLEKEEAKAAAKPKKRKQEYRDALADTTPGQAAKAAGKSTYRGKYWERTVRLPPKYRDIVLEIYKQEPRAKSIADLERWFFAKGIEAYMNGERPEYTETIERAIELPDFGGK